MQATSSQDLSSIHGEVEIGPNEVGGLPDTSGEDFICIKGRMKVNVFSNDLPSNCDLVPYSRASCNKGL